VAGGLVTAGSVGTWYEGLEKPFFNPPGWVFGPVWTALYALMGVALYLVWRKGLRRPEVKVALFVFAVQLLLNAAWSPAFFGLRSTVAGLCVIIPLWIAILATIIAFFKVSKIAGSLLIPYMLWTSFAVVLNASLVILNS
jgi:tryptophan-rich sensory protein